MDFLFFLLPPAEDSPEGLWLRTGDTFAGCVLRVEKIGSEIAGRIVVLPESMARAGWVEGDLKWRNITHDSGGRWRMQDLRKHYDTRTSTVAMLDYGVYQLTVARSVHLGLHPHALPFFPAQRWKKFEATKNPSS